jgi:uncharacterized membrane protein HdeD (DUF308 family)
VKIEMADEKKSSMGLRILEIAAGLIFIVLGVYFLTNWGAALATLSTFLGIALIILGIASFLRIFARGISGWQRFLNLITSILAIILGILIIDNWAYGVLTLGYLVGLGFLFAGISSAARGTAGSIIVGILSIIVGFFVILNPGIGGITAVLLVAVILVIFGLESIVSGIVGRWV